jgi:hypothetical protein
MVNIPANIDYLKCVAGRVLRKRMYTMLRRTELPQ